MAPSVWILACGLQLFGQVGSFTFTLKNHRHPSSFVTPNSWIEQCTTRHHLPPMSPVCLRESNDANADYVEAENLPAIQALFNKYCDEQGLMNKETLEKLPVIAFMLVRDVALVRQS
jgi:hypothetical protein